MLDPAGTVAKRAAATACLALLFAPWTHAQTPPQTSAPPAKTFLTRSGFSFSWAGLVDGDPRFSWDALLGIDLDLADYRVGRLNFTADYEAVLGDERRAFDLNHANYTLEASASYWVHSIELAGVFHHVSRHLSDRPNPATIAWNVAEVRATRQFLLGKSIVDTQLEVGRVLQHTFVDYVWTSNLRLAIRRSLSPRAALFAGGTGGLIGVDRTRLDRGRLCGARLESGVRLNGQTGALELFVGYERRIDAYPLDRQRARWFALGFRLVSR
jgi:hypothetical protein